MSTDERSAPAKRQLYRIFGLGLEADLALPELPALDGDRADYRFFLLEPNESAPVGQIWTHRWHDPDGNLAIAIAATPDGYLLRFPGVADFLLDPTCTRIRCRPQPTTSESSIRHLLLDQVMPRALAHHGNLVLHASAVLLPAGCVCFVGQSGAGKSTLASSLHAAGHRLLADDAVWLRPGDTGITCVASYEGVRLWPRALERLALAGMSHRPVSDFSNKKRLIPRQEPRAADPPFPMAALFVIEPPAKGEVTNDILIEPVCGSGYMVELIKQAFLLDVKSREHAADHFRMLGRVTSANNRMYRLSYPREFDLLPRVRERIIERLERGS